LFSDIINVSQGSAATYAKNGGIFNNCKFTEKSSSEKQFVSQEDLTELWL